MKKAFNKCKLSIVFFIFTAICAKVLNARIYDTQTKLDLSSLKNVVKTPSSHSNYY